MGNLKENLKLSSLSEAMLKTQKNTIRNEFKQQWFDAISFHKSRHVYTAIWYNVKQFANMGNADLSCQLLPSARCQRAKHWLKSLKIQNFLRPGSQILAYKTMLRVFVVRTLTWYSQILEMWSIHTGEQINNSKNPNGKDCITFHRTTAYHCCHPLHAFTGSCEMFSFLRYDSWSALPWKYEPGHNRIRMFLKTPVVFSGFSLLSLERSSLAVFAAVQDVVHLLFHVSIKWEAALLVHHFVVRQRLIESAFRWFFVSVI